MFNDISLVAEEDMEPGDPISAIVRLEMAHNSGLPVSRLYHARKARGDEPILGHIIISQRATTPIRLFLHHGRVERIGSTASEALMYYSDPMLDKDEVVGAIMRLTNSLKARDQTESSVGATDPK